MLAWDQTHPISHDSAQYVEVYACAYVSVGVCGEYEESRSVVYLI